MRASQIWMCAILTMVLSCACGAAAQQTAPIVVGYVFVPKGNLQPGQVDAHKLTRVNYAFANIKDGRMVEGESTDAGNLAYLTALRKENPRFSVLISVGGWLWSGNFSDMALTEKSRKVFIESVMEFLRRYDLDGLDIDWEFPGMEGSTKHFRSVDGKNFTLLLKELRKRFDEERARTGRQLFLTIAAAASQDYLAHTEMGKVQRYVDTINLMGYDYLEPGEDKITGHHAPLYANPADSRKNSVDGSVRAFEAAGVPAAKIVLGVPFYGHEWGDVPGQNHGLFEPGKAIPNAYATYNAITTTMLGHGFVRYWDAVADAPYLYNEEKKIFVTYEDPESLKLKCRYVLDHKLGGVMYWDHASDSSGVLLGTIDAALGVVTEPNR